jgi:integrase
VWGKFCQTHKITSLRPFVSAINNAYLDNKWDALARNHLYNKCIKGLHNQFARSDESKPKKSLSIKSMKQIATTIDKESFEDCRDWAAAVFAFFALLRRSEYTNGALLKKNVSRGKEGIEITITRSKTSNVPQKVAMSRRKDELCPILAYNQYVKVRGKADKDDPFFKEKKDQVIPMSGEKFIHRIRQRYGQVTGKDAKLIAGHSFRRGGATAMAKAGLSTDMIKQQGRWRSTTMPAVYADIQNDRGMRMTPSRQLAERTTARRSK